MSAHGRRNFTRRRSHRLRLSGGGLNLEKLEERIVMDSGGIEPARLDLDAPDSAVTVGWGGASRSANSLGQGDVRGRGASSTIRGVVPTRTPALQRELGGTGLRLGSLDAQTESNQDFETIRLDFGTRTSAVGRGWIRVERSGYDSERGYGWVGELPFEAAFNGWVADPVKRDFHYGADQTFRVDVPNGLYQVTAIAGGYPLVQYGMEVSAEGRMVASGREDQLEFQVDVIDGSLDLRFEAAGASMYYLLGGLEIEPVSMPELTASAGGVYSAVEGSPVLLQATASGGVGDLDFRWDLDGDGFFETMGSQITHYFLDDGEYPVVLSVTDAVGQATLALAMVSVANADPVAAMHVPAAIAAGAPAVFHASAIDPGPIDQAAGLSYSWDFGDGTTRDGNSPSHVFASPGTYTVALTVQDKDGGEVLVKRTVAVEPATPPEILEVTPEGIVVGSVGAVQVTFDEPIAPSSFTADDVVYTGPDGPVVIEEIRPLDPVGQSGFTRFEIVTAELTTPGEYSLAFGPDITDMAGTPMAEAISFGFTLIRAIDVTSHGAVGDGVTNDKAAIEAAIAEAHRTGIGAIYLPAGTYRIGFSAVQPGTTDRITIGSDLQILGAGRDVSTIRFDPGADDFSWSGLRVAAEHTLELDDLTLQGPDVGGNQSSYLIHREGPKAGVVYDSKIQLRRVDLLGEPAAAIFGESGTLSPWTGSLGLDLQDCDVTGWAQAVSWYCGYTSDDALHYFHAQGTRFHDAGLTAEESPTGKTLGHLVYVHPNTSLALEGCSFDNNPKWALHWYGQSPIGAPQYATIRDCDFGPGANIAILTTDRIGTVTLVENCTFRNAGHAIQARSALTVRNSVFEQGGNVLGGQLAYTSAEEMAATVVTIVDSEINNGAVTQPFDTSSLRIERTTFRGESGVTNNKTGSGLIEIIDCIDESVRPRWIEVASGRVVVRGNMIRGHHISGAISFRDNVQDLLVENNVFYGTEEPERYSRAFHTNSPTPIGAEVLRGSGNVLRPEGWSQIYWNERNGLPDGIPSSLWD